MKIFIVLCESPLKILKIAIYRFLISFLVPELLMFTDLQNSLKNGMKNARSGIKSIKIDKICDVRINWNFGIRMQNKVSHSSIKMFVFNLIFSVPGPSL